MPGQPSKVMVTKRVSIASATLSKLNSFFAQTRLCTVYRLSEPSFGTKYSPWHSSSVWIRGFTIHKNISFLGNSHLHASITAHPEAPLEQLDANDGKHEEEEDGDEEDVADVLHSHNDALHHVLQTLGSVDRSAKVKCCKFTKRIQLKSRAKKRSR